MSHRHRQMLLLGLVGPLLWLLLQSGAALALDPKKAITQYVHDVWRMENGLPSNNVGAILQTRDGYLWFGTEGGLARFDSVRLPRKKDFEFHYTALSYLDPSKVKFKYKLEGYDDDWVDTDTRRVAYFTHLPPGEYRFRVMACNNDGVWNETGAAFEFYLKPHFYQTRLFYALVGLFLVALGPGIYVLRVRQLKARQQELAQLVDERTRDLTEAKQQLEEMNQTLEQRVEDGVKALAGAERMAAYGEAVAGVAHEVRNPLFALQSAAYVLKEKLRGRDEAGSQLRIVEHETKRIATLMDDLLAFAKPRELLLAPTDPESLLREAVETYQAEHDSKFPEIVLATNPNLPPILVDRSRLVQVFVNLIANAAKHARGLTTVTLSAEMVAESELCIRVKDDGAGIRPEDLPKIFDPFFTTGKGSGLGLAIVRRLVTEHGGTISVESEPGKGTVFTICLPTKLPEGEIRNPNDPGGKSEARNPKSETNSNDTIPKSKTGGR